MSHSVVEIHIFLLVFFVFFLRIFLASTSSSARFADVAPGSERAVANVMAAKSAAAKLFYNSAAEKTRRAKVAERKAAEAARKAKEAEDNLPRKTIEVTVLKGRDLTKMDFAFKGGGKSDPYVLVKFGKETNKSEVIKKNLNPTWNFKCVVGREKRVTKTFLGNGGGQMTFEVFDWDQVGSDEKVHLYSERRRFYRDFGSCFIICFIIHQCIHPFLHSSARSHHK